VALCFIYSPCSNKAEAKKIGEALLTEKLIACANILNNITSIYNWDNKQTTSNEAVLIAKTITTYANKVMERIKSLHSYDVPSITAFDATNAEPQWQKWAEEQLAK